MNRFQHLVWRNSRLLARNMRANCFHPAWGARYRQESLTFLFQTVNQWLQSLQVEYWITFGTLLGYYRENGILYPDKDIDFGLPVSEAPRLWENRGKLPRGFRLLDTSYKHHGPKFYVDYRAWEADLYFYEVRGDRLLPQMNSTLSEDNQVLLHQEIFPLQEISFLDATTFTPNQPEDTLTRLYHYIGPNAERDPESGFYRPRP